MKFTKMHGAGNDYVYVNAFKQDRDCPEISRMISDRHTGIGADGLIIAIPSDKADFQMRMFNADGSEGEMCGNGIRCLVAFAIDEGIVRKNEGLKTVETGAGVLTVTPEFNGNEMTNASVGMGYPVFEPSKVPVNILVGDWPILNYPLAVDGYDLELTFVSMGNPHAIAFIDDDVDNFPLESVGPKVENHSLFPNKVNFEITNVLTERHVKTRVWERGSGITMACGTGACAVMAAAKLKNLVGDCVEVELPGGILEVRWTGCGELTMRGPVKTVFKGEWIG
ncbi:uncharacterized protein METZ01_LOCUS201255 [marine metagenome]|uniref:diaminopimelate epimerase n=1 Tax=marine metagenome TaxID=408172 RepID=A0A382EEJ1_9ZZZZ